VKKLYHYIEFDPRFSPWYADFFAHLLQVEYADAWYRLKGGENARNPILLDDLDRRRFREILPMQVGSL